MTRQRNGRGFTLVEVLIVVVILGLITFVIAAAFTVIVRSSPSNENRTDDARSLLGLTTWLPQDVASTQINGFDAYDPSTSYEPTYGCLGSPPGTTLLRLDWGQSGSTYSAHYRYVQVGDQHRIRRYSCRDGGTADELNLTSDLPLIGGLPPVKITIAQDGGDDVGLEFEVTVEEGGVPREILSIDAYTENVPTTMPPLAPDPTAPPPTTQPNVDPVATDYAYQVIQGQTVSLVVAASDANGDSLTATFTTNPVWIYQVSPGSLDYVVDATAQTAPTSVTFRVDVADPAAATDFAMITIEIVPTTATTTTTSTTTSTTVIPTCAAGIQAVTPPDTANATNQGGPTDVGKLVDEIRVSISSNGFCGPLVLSFDPDPTTASREVLAFNGAQSVEFPSNMLWRDSDGVPHLLELREGVAGAVLDTDSLTVD